MDSLILTDYLTNVFLDKSLFGFAAINDELATTTSCKTAIVTLMPYPDLNYIYNPFEYFQMLDELRVIHGEKLNEIKKFLDTDSVKYATPPASPKDDNEYLAKFSYKWAAIHAGLGFIGKNDVFIHEKYAQRVRISCLLVDLALHVYTGKVISKCGTCDLCVRTCPHHFINMPQFYLGNIAPDAVHCRANYTSDYKKKSHLCVGDKKWGMITNNNEWQNNVINFLYNHKNSENYDFIIGYCCHILSDIYNNIALWIPFKQKYADEVEKGVGNLMRHETNMIDIELALTYKKRDIFWSNIQQSVGVDLPGIIYATEIEKQKDNILNIWYADKKRQDLTSNEIVTVEIIMNFIKNAVDFVVLTLQKHLN